MATSKVVNSLFPILTFILFVVALYFNYAASTGQLSELDVGEVSGKYSLEITPAGWTFTIWAFIYVWQALWIIYVIVLTCKYPMENGIIFGVPFWIAYNVANVCNAIWIVVWVNEYIWPSAVVLLGIACGLITAAVLSHVYVFSDGGDDEQGAYRPFADEAETRRPWLSGDAAKIHRPLIFALVLNGIPFYATWTVIATNLNIGVVLCYKQGLGNQTASLLMLSILTAIILCYWFLDFYKLRKYLQFTYSPYLVLIVAFCGVLTNDYTSKATFIFTLVLLVAASVAFVAKIIMGIALRNQPLDSF